MGHVCSVTGMFGSGAYASDVKCMYSSVPGHIVDCSEVMNYLYLDRWVMCT